MSPKSEEQFQKIRDESRKRIIQAALEQFSQKGFERSSMKELAEKAGVSKGLLYNYFSSKKALLMALFQASMEEMDKVIEETPSGGPRTRLIGMFETFFNDLEENPGFWRLFASLALQEQGFEEVRQMMADKVNAYYELLEGIFSELGYEDPRAEAVLVGAIFDGVAVEYLAMGDNFPFKTVRQHIMKKYGNDAVT